jgi:butyryl-CoA dehydrogenase
LSSPEGERQLLRANLREFAEKQIEGRVASIEKEGIGEELVTKLAGQGVLGASIPPDFGGTGLDRQSYLVVLEELARSSPSVAVKVLIANSLFAPLVSRSSVAGEALRAAATGRSNVAVAYLGVTEGGGPGLTLVGGRLTGAEDYLLNSTADAVVVRASGDTETLLLVRGGLRRVKDHPMLGLRGLKLSSVEFDTSDCSVVSRDGAAPMKRAIDEVDLELAAICLGIASRAVAKALEYSSVRKTFEHPLKDYQPVAFSVASLRSEEEFLRKFVYSGELAETERAMARVRALDLVKRAARYAVQVHGGYGYFDDFGISRLYRDAMALSVLFSGGFADMERLSSLVYSSRSGFL